MKYLNLDETESISLIVETSPVWETILGIAGYTHGQIRHTFDLDQRWESSTMPNTLRESLNEIQKTNFWYSLILLQDKCSAQTIEEFSNKLLNM
ncbi:ArsR family transcriptional regulator, partial [Viridibacillus sp. NPDC093762]